MPEIRLKANQLFSTSLFRRFLLIIIIPICILQSITVFMFYHRHWSRVTDTMVANLARELNLIIEFDQKYGEKIATTAGNELGFHFHRSANNTGEVSKLWQLMDTNGDIYETLKKELKTEIVAIYLSNDQRMVKCILQKPQNQHFLVASFSTRRIESNTTYIFVLWVIGTALIMLIVATIFVKNQVKSILSLTDVAQKLSRGEIINQFQPSGSKEIRAAGIAFLRMKNKLERNVKNKLEFLAHISHDMRTPITRIKLLLEMINLSNFETSKKRLEDNIKEIEKMLNNYLHFFKDEGNEMIVEIDIISFMQKLLFDFNDHRIHFDFEIDINNQSKKWLNNQSLKQKKSTNSISIRARSQALRRAISNIIDNAKKFANENIKVSIIMLDTILRIQIEDDGPGMTQKQLESLNKNDYISDLNPNKQGSRQLDREKQGFGLGLPISRNIILGHGGEISFQNEKNTSGLCVIIDLPLPTTSV